MDHGHVLIKAAESIWQRPWWSPPSLYELVPWSPWSRTARRRRWPRRRCTRRPRPAYSPRFHAPRRRSVPPSTWTGTPSPIRHPTGSRPASRTAPCTACPVPRPPSAWPSTRPVTPGTTTAPPGRAPASTPAAAWTPSLVPPARPVWPSTRAVTPLVIQRPAPGRPPWSMPAAPWMLSPASPPRPARPSTRPETGYVYNGKRWTSSALDPGTALLGVSCPSGSFCAAVDASGQALRPPAGKRRTRGPRSLRRRRVEPGRQRLSQRRVLHHRHLLRRRRHHAGDAALYNGTAWSDSAVDAGNQLNGVSCVNPLLRGGRRIRECRDLQRVDLGGQGRRQRSLGDIVPAHGRLLLLCRRRPCRQSSDHHQSVGHGGVDIGDRRDVDCRVVYQCSRLRRRGQERQGHHLAGRAPSRRPSPTPRPSTASRAIRCQEPQNCWAVDKTGKGTSYNGTTWSSSVTKIDTGKILESVSCLVAPATYCSAVDGSGNVVTFNGTTWSAPINIDGTHVLKSVSCTSSSVCVAVDGSGSVFTTTNDWATGSVSSSKPATGHGRPLSCFNTTTCQAMNGQREGVLDHQPMGHRGLVQDRYPSIEEHLLLGDDGLLGRGRRRLRPHQRQRLVQHHGGADRLSAPRGTRRMSRQGGDPTSSALGGRW